MYEISATQLRHFLQFIATDFVHRKIQYHTRIVTESDCHAVLTWDENIYSRNSIYYNNREYTCHEKLLQNLQKGSK